MKIISIALLLCGVSMAAELKNMTSMCVTCLTSNPAKNYYSCAQCYDAKPAAANACGWMINNILECPRDPSCPNIVISKDDVENTR